MAADTLIARNGARSPGLAVVASYDRYEDAQRAIDRLADAHFPVERLKVVGEDIAFVEDITGRRTSARAAGEGAIGGAVIAGVIGVLFGLLNWLDPLISAVLLGLYGVLFGAVVGAALGLIGHWVTRGERDFASLRSMSAKRFDLLADEGVSDEARMRLAA